VGGGIREKASRALGATRFPDGEMVMSKLEKKEGILTQILNEKRSDLKGGLGRDDWRPAQGEKENASSGHYLLKCWDLTAP